MTWSSISSSLKSSSSDLGSSSSSAGSGVYEIDKSLIRFRNKRITLVAFRHFRAPSKNNVFGIIHHFGVLEVRLPGSLITSNTFIKFEKGKLRGEEKPPTEGLKPVGRVTVGVFDQTSFGPNDEDSDEDSDEVSDEVSDEISDEIPDEMVPEMVPEMVHEVTLPQGCQKILMQKLLNLLTTERTLSYSFWKNNCWKYVYDCERAMLEAFAALPNTSLACKETLDEARKNLPEPSLLSDVFHWQKLLASAFVAALPTGCLNRISCLLSLYVGAQQLRQGGVVLYKLINFASEAVKLEGVKGLGTSLYGVQNMHKILEVQHMHKILGVHQHMHKIRGVQHMHKIQGVYKIPTTVAYKILTTVARALGGILCWKGVAICFAVFMSLAIAWWLGKCVANNTTFSRRFNNSRLRRSGSSQCS